MGCVFVSFLCDRGWWRNRAPEGNRAWPQLLRRSPAAAASAGTRLLLCVCMTVAVFSHPSFPLLSCAHQHDECCFALQDSRTPLHSAAAAGRADNLSVLLEILGPFINNGDKVRRSGQRERAPLLLCTTASVGSSQNQQQICSCSE